MAAPSHQLRLRTLLESDAASLASHANNRNIWRQMEDSFPVPFTVTDAQLLVQSQPPGSLLFALDVDQQVVGLVALQTLTDYFRKNARLHFWLGEQWWNKGLMTDAIGMVTELAFKNHHLHRLYAEVLEGNHAAARALEKNGYIKEAILQEAAYKDGKYLDIHLWSKLSPYRR